MIHKYVIKDWLFSSYLIPPNGTLASVAHPSGQHRRFPPLRLLLHWRRGRFSLHITLVLFLPSHQLRQTTHNTQLLFGFLFPCVIPRLSVRMVDIRQWATDNLRPTGRRQSTAAPHPRIRRLRTRSQIPSTYIISMHQVLNTESTLNHSFWIWNRFFGKKSKKKNF